MCYLRETGAKAAERAGDEQSDPDTAADRGRGGVWVEVLRLSQAY